MLERMGPLTLGRFAAACWLVVGALLLRIATNGSFVDLAFDAEPRTRAWLAVACAVGAGLAVLLAASLALGARWWPLACSAIAGLLLIPIAVPLLAAQHGSAVALPPLGLLAALFSYRAGRGLPGPAGGG